MEYLAALGCPFPSSFETRMLESRELITNYMYLYVSNAKKMETTVQKHGQHLPYSSIYSSQERDFPTLKVQAKNKGTEIFLD